MRLLVEVHLVAVVRAGDLHAHGGTVAYLGLFVQKGYFVVGVLQPQHLPGTEELHISRARIPSRVPHRSV